MNQQWLYRLKYFLHPFGWAFLYILPYLFSFQGLPSYKTIFSHPGDYIHFSSFLLLIVFSYVNYFYLVPKFYFAKKYFSYFLIVIACFWIVTEVPFKIMAPALFANGRHNFNNQPNPFLFGKNYTILLYIISVFVSITAYTRVHLHKLENEKLNAELLFLKAQINPHFLFNTLNSIYSLAIAKDDRTPDAIVQLSELMRYVLKDAKDDLVPLDKEINYISNYILLQQNRLGDTVRINYSTKGNFYANKIPPLILISFIENAFKHGVNPDKNSEIKIEIKLTDHTLNLFVKNKIVGSFNNEGGIGLYNASERLQLLYPNKHSLKTREEDNNYLVELAISL